MQQFFFKKQRKNLYYVVCIILKPRCVYGSATDLINKNIQTTFSVYCQSSYYSLTNGFFVVATKRTHFQPFWLEAHFDTTSKTST